MALFGMLGKKKRGSTIALDLGSSSLKVVQLKEEPSGPRLVKLGIAGIPYGGIKDGQVTDIKAVANTLSRLLSVNQIKEKFCISALSGEQVIVRLVKLPPMSEQEVKQAISYQIERYIPLPPDQVNLDVQVLGEVMEGETKKVSVLLIAAQKEAINSQIKTLQEAKLTPTAIEVESFVALRSSLESAYLKDAQTFGQTLLLIDIGASSSDISVVSNGVLRFTRIIPVAGINFTRAISTALNLNFEEAERLKKEQGAALVNGEGEGLDLPTAKQIVNILTPILGSLLNEIQRSLAYYESRFRRAKIDKVILSGGSSKLRNIKEYLNRELGLEVVEVNPWQNIVYDEKTFSPDYLSRVAPLLSVGCGLALRELGPESQEKFTKPVRLDDNFEFGSSRQTGGFGG